MNCVAFFQRKIAQLKSVVYCNLGKLQLSSGFSIIHLCKVSQWFQGIVIFHTCWLSRTTIVYFHGNGLKPWWNHLQPTLWLLLVQYLNYATQVTCICSRISTGLKLFIRMNVSLSKDFNFDQVIKYRKWNLCLLCIKTDC